LGADMILLSIINTTTQTAY